MQLLEFALSNPLKFNFNIRYCSIYVVIIIVVSCIEVAPYIVYEYIQSCILYTCLYLNYVYALFILFDKPLLNSFLKSNSNH